MEAHTQMCLFFTISNSNFIRNSASLWGGVIYANYNSSFTIGFSNFVKNKARYGGGVLNVKANSSFSIDTSSFFFTQNNASVSGGGIMCVDQSSFNITNDTIENSAAYHGAVMYILQSLFNIASSSFTKNRAYHHGGVIHTLESRFSIVASCFTENIVASSVCSEDLQFIHYCAGIDGGVMYIQQLSFSLASSNFIKNSASYCGGAIYIDKRSLLNVTASSFTNNRAFHGAVMFIKASSFDINTTNFTQNSAWRGGVFDNNCFDNEGEHNNTSDRDINRVIYYDSNVLTIKIGNKIQCKCDVHNGVITSAESSFTINSSHFANNHAVLGVINAFNSSFTTTNSIYANNYVNNHAKVGGVACIFKSSFSVNYSDFTNNTATLGGVMHIVSTLQDADSSSVADNGGIVIVSGRFYQNVARYGGAILAIDSTIRMKGETTMVNNLAKDGSGGGIYLLRSDLAIQGTCNFIQNDALRGGGIHASSLSITVYQQGDLRFTNNIAKYGGGTYLEVSTHSTSKFPLIFNKKSENGSVIFVNNDADSGGAVYINDSASSCLPFSIACFIQSVTINKKLSDATKTKPIIFFGNTATNGSNIFGGLLDRCTPNQVHTTDNIPVQYYHNGVHYLQTISNIAVDSIASNPVRVCFCDSTGQPNCSFEAPTFRVKRGQALTVSAVVVNQVNQSMNAKIRASQSKAHGRMDEGQVLQEVTKSCTELTYSVSSPDDSETLTLYYPNDSCQNKFSGRDLIIQFLKCTCSVGFKPSPSNSRCECDCDPALSPYITNCDYKPIQS